MKKYIITIFFHDPKTKEITHKERLKTKPMTEADFEICKNKRLKGLKNYSYAVGMWIL